PSPSSKVTTLHTPRPAPRATTRVCKVSIAEEKNCIEPPFLRGYSRPRHRKLHIIPFRASAKSHSFRCGSSSHKIFDFAGTLINKPPSLAAGYDLWTLCPEVGFIHRHPGHPHRHS